MNKKYFYLLAAGMLLFCTGRAQIKKGESLLGGSIWFQKLDNNPVAPNYPNTTIAIVMPSFGKAIDDNLVVGLNPSYGYTKLVEDDGYNPVYTLKYRTYGLTFFIRRYKELGRNFSIFLEGDLRGTYFRQKGSYEGSGSLYVDSKSYNIYASLSGGIAYRLTHRWLLETGFPDLGIIGFGHAREDGSIQSYRKSNGLNLGTNLNTPLNNFSIGCRYILD